MLRNSGQGWIGSLSTDCNGRRANAKRKIRWTEKLILLPYASASKNFFDLEKTRLKRFAQNISHNIYIKVERVGYGRPRYMENAKSKLKDNSLKPN